MKQDLIYGELTYKINGVIFDVQNDIGPYGKEKQYSDLAAKKFLDKEDKYQSVN